MNDSNQISIKISNIRDKQGFVNCINKCKGKVSLKTALNNDFLDLKSLFAQIVFLNVISCDPEQLKGSKLIVDREDDYNRLKAFI